MNDVIELAKQAGASRYTNRHYPDRPTHTFTAGQLALYTALVRNAALDEAAQKCLKLWDLRDTELAMLHAAKCAKAIESLKEPTP